MTKTKKSNKADPIKPILNNKPDLRKIDNSNGRPFRVVINEYYENNQLIKVEEKIPLTNQEIIEIRTIELKSKLVQKQISKEEREELAILIS